ncbi:MAG: HTH-type transcriptional repressor PurR [Candidatus Atribacteria bacterium ADurb.Bin276]|uniref:HTH-type transcriptional repressor PurR n=1 Tax=Candidatus Atribacter allofermentans TaxID=1852833 RepID=A0A1V5SIN4_9BACT|nr:MAG: HTH-type transcriptional repressor PurR [Candidatus Atribacteria bacterium ADurb.Bin276]
MVISLSTIYDIAKRAGVSPATVSRALNNQNLVKEETRKKIHKIAEEMNYSPNFLARSLVKKQTNTIALIISDITNPFFTTVARGVEDTASQKGFNTIFCNTDENIEKEKQYVNLMLQRRVDGIIIASCGSGNNLGDIRNRNLPLVLVDRAFPGNNGWDSVVGDSEEGAFLLTKHLIEVHHHQKIAIISGPPVLSTSQDRVRGYLRALRDYNIKENPEWIISGEFKENFGYQIALKFLQYSDIKPTAVFAGNNFIAIGIIRAAREMDIEIPGDLSLVTFDDLEMASYTCPFLTVAKQPAYTMGSMATEFLLQRISGEKIREKRIVVLKPEIIIRKSCGCIQ